MKFSKSAKAIGVSFLAVAAWAAVVWAADFSDAESGIRPMMERHAQSESTGMFAPTLCDLFGVARPKGCEVDSLEPVMTLAAERLNRRPVQKGIIFCPDAIGDRQFKERQDDFALLLAETDYLMTGSNVLPSVTPVNFATIFSGLSPAAHGIKKYERPVLKVETIFDTFSDAGKKIALVAENDCSIDKIFRGRKIDYFSRTTNESSFQLAKQLVRQGDYDLIVCYDGGYDSTMHKAGIWADQSIAAMRDSIRRYLELAALCDECWAEYDRVAAFVPDHGSHDLPTGHGSHGSDSDDDTIVNHAWRIRPAGASGQKEAPNDAQNDGQNETLKNSQNHPPTDPLAMPGRAFGERRMAVLFGVEVPFRWIAPGVFRMGSPENEPLRDAAETLHDVELTAGFWLAETETTQAFYQAVIGSNPSEFSGDLLPVDTVSWDEATAFCAALNRRLNLDGAFRLPTEAEWEYAARGGDESSGIETLADGAWIAESTDTGSTHPVGTKAPNGWGLCDMRGNLWEWCADGWSDYPQEKVSDPFTSGDGKAVRIDRGGCWDSPPQHARFAWRGVYEHDRKSRFVGFRIARTPSGI